jgi:hypothetical protein
MSSKMSHRTAARRVERARVAALQVADLYTKFPPGEVAAFVKTMAGDPPPDAFCRPRHVLHFDAATADPTR